MRFQHYEVLRRDDGSLFELGRGAMGITYKAFDTNLRTNVALKVINSTYLNSEVARQRFLREARAAAAIRHPNVAAVFHLGNEDDAYFYAMEFIDGETVEAYMQREGAVPTLMALEIAAQVAKALAAAEKQGLVHRDIKPSNLMLVREDGDDDFIVKVIDFGLAKAADKESADTATLTMGGFLGTPHFASPEQLEERELDTRSDIYSLGVTLYYMLAGRTPFSGSLAQVMSQHLHREPPLELLADQPRQVVALLERMMEKDPDRRPQTPAELRREIEACIEAVREAQSGSSGGAPAEGDPDTETLVVEEKGTSALEPAPGVVLAERFELISRYEPGQYGNTFKARNLETGEIVAVLILNPNLLPTSEAYTRLENEVNALQAVRHPAVMRVYSLERAHHLSFVSREWVEGESLLDTMRSQGRLPVADAMKILTSLAGGLEAVQRAQVPCPELSASWIVLAKDPATGTIVPKFNALNFSHVAPASPDQTLVASPSAMLRGSFHGNSAGEFVFSLAAIAYQVLGGVHAANPTETFVPIPGLSEEANLVLRRAFDPASGFSSPVAFVSALVDAAGDPVVSTPAAPKPPPVPERVPAAATTGSGKGGRGILVLAGVLVGGLLLIVALLAMLVVPRLRNAMVAGQEIAAATPEPVVEPAATPDPTPEPTPEPTPVDPHQLALEKGLSEAQQMTANDEFAGALHALDDLRREFPDEPLIKERMEMAAAKLRAQSPVLSDVQLARLKEPLELAAQAGSDSAAMLLGDSLMESHPEEAFTHYLLAADAGNSEAMLAVGDMYAKGKGTDKSLEKALRWYQDAANKGNPAAMYAVGECLYFGNGTEESVGKAVYYLTQASAFNDKRAKNLLGDIYRKGAGPIKPNLAEAYRLFFEAAKDGNLDAQGNLGVMIANGEVPGEPANPEKAVGLFREGAEQGNGPCMFYYALCLEKGIGIGKNFSAAKSWYVKAAEAGNDPARQWCSENDVKFTPPAGD